ncbi:hypothetical protein EVAR_79822_1 [Eumeta japonica]|uniref:Uncharacterized protein n=1 Tax=Eumeta variegata TaxID=151549 RepID=A0A4C1WU02_EUMVA|nr:hypothetical protein EVAR_79822_1 [Eumeta japonica]
MSALAPSQSVPYYLQCQRLVAARRARELLCIGNEAQVLKIWSEQTRMKQMVDSKTKKNKWTYMYFLPSTPENSTYNDLGSFQDSEYLY